MGGPNVAVYSAIDSPVIIVSMGGPNVAVYSAMDSPVIIASMRDQKWQCIVQWIVQLVELAGGPNVALYVQWIVQL